MSDDEKQTEAESSETRVQTAEERESEARLNELDLAFRESIQGGLEGSTGAGLDILTRILRGEELPGNLAGIAGGISPEVTDRLVGQALGDVAPQFQALGLSDSGVRARVGGEISADIRASSERFNITNRLNLLKSGFTGIASVQQPALFAGSTLGSRLAGLRTITDQTDASSFEKVTTKEGFSVQDAIKLAIIAGSVALAPATGGASVAAAAPLLAVD